MWNTIFVLKFMNLGVIGYDWKWLPIGWNSKIKTYESGPYQNIAVSRLGPRANLLSLFLSNLMISLKKSLLFLCFGGPSISPDTFLAVPSVEKERPRSWFIIFYKSDKVFWLNHNILLRSFKYIFGLSIFEPIHFWDQ